MKVGRVTKNCHINRDRSGDNIINISDFYGLTQETLISHSGKADLGVGWGGRVEQGRKHRLCRYLYSKL